MCFNIHPKTFDLKELSNSGLTSKAPTNLRVHTADSKAKTSYLQCEAKTHYDGVFIVQEALRG